jgi:hypothetical protein
MQLEPKTLGCEPRCFFHERDQSASASRALSGRQEYDAMIAQGAAREIASLAPELDACVLKGVPL